VTVFVVVVATVFGALIGSFLNVVLWRVPRGESIVSPGSHCPACETPLGPLELVPVLSWVLLRGRCRHCGVGISVRYPLVELGCAAVLAVVAWLVVG
jgi:leader peptidase (prepilin peptidase)/N-methyltransferase